MIFCKVSYRPIAGMIPHSLIAPSCATAESLETGRSRSFVRDSSRFRYSRPAAWLTAEGAKNDDCSRSRRDNSSPEEQADPIAFLLGEDDLAGHGGEHRAVFVYQIESYRYWQDQLQGPTSSTDTHQTSRACKAGAPGNSNSSQSSALCTLPERNFAAKQSP